MDELPPDVAAAVAENRATDPRLEQNAPAPDPAPEPEPVADPDPAPAEAAEPDPGADPGPEPKKKKSPVEVLTGRVGHLTKTLSTKDAELAAANRRAEAAEALLAARAPLPAPAGETPPMPATTVTTVNPTTGRTYTDAEFQAAVAAEAAGRAFSAEANALYEAGAKKFPAWEENMNLLRATGVLAPGETSKVLIEAALAGAESREGAAAVMNELAQDPAEAQRITSLPPVQMGLAIAKLAARVAPAAGARQTPISNAPPPIPRIDGAVAASIDLGRIAEGDSMAAYVEARKRQGSVWAEGRRRG